MPLFLALGTNLPTGRDYKEWMDSGRRLALFACLAWGCSALGGCDGEAPRPGVPAPPTAPAPAPAAPSGPGEGADPPSTPEGWSSFEAGRRHARANGKPLLVLVSHPAQHCPPAEYLRDEVLADPSVDAVCVRVYTDGARGASPEERRLVQRCRYDGAIPVLAVVTPDLDILARLTGRLYGSYDLNGLAQARSVPTPLTRAEILERVQAAVRDQADWGTREAQLARDASASAQLRLALLRFERGRWEAAHAALEAALKGPLQIDEVLQAIDLLDWLGQGDAARALATERLARDPAAAGAGWLVVRSQRLSPSTNAANDRGVLASHVALAQRAGDRRLELALRAARVALGSVAPPEASTVLPEDLEALEAMDATVFPATDREGPGVLNQLSDAALRRADYAQAAHWMRLLLERHPDSAHALMCLHGQLDRVERAAATTTPPQPPPARPEK